MSTANAAHFTEQKVIETRIILTSQERWEPWISQIRNQAMDTKVWTYVNPETPKDELPSLDEPQPPVIASLFPGKTTLAELDTTQQGAFDREDRIYVRNLKQYDTRVLSIAAIRTHIYATVPFSSQAFIYGCDTVYDMLKELHRRFKPSDRAERMSVKQAYRTLLKGPKATTILDWLYTWEVTYQDVVRLKLPMASEEDPLFDFLAAIETVDPVWSANKQQSLNYMLEIQPESKQTMQQLVEEYRAFRRIEATKGKQLAATRGTFATFQGQSSDGKSKQDRKPKSPCLCGEEHYFNMCQYINKDLRTSAWKVDLQKEVDKKISEAESSGTRLWDSIKRARKTCKDRLASKKSNNSGTAKSTTNVAVEDSPVALTAIYHLSAPITKTLSTSQPDTDMQLRNSVILDGGSNANVCNNPDRFIIEKKVTGEAIMSGNASSQVIGHGSFVIRAKVTTGTGTTKVKEITIKNAKLVPGFLTSVVSESYLEDLGVYRHPKTSTLRRGKEVICNITRTHGLYFLENNTESDVQAVLATRRSAQPRPPISASVQQWHQKMGHISPETIAHLPQSTVGTGILDGTGPRTVECPDCAVSKAKRVISRRPTENPSEPFASVSYDMAFFEPAYNGESKMTHLHDQFSGFHAIYTHATKSQTMGAIMDFAKFVKRQFGKDLVLFRRDNETSLGKIYDRFIAEEGILDTPSAPYAPSQNGDAERAGGVIITKARSMRIAAHLPSNLWPEIVSTAAYLLNRTPIESKGWKTPYELLHGKKPDISHIKVYGCRAYPLIHNIPKTRKLEPRAEIGYLIGYDSTNIFRIWVPFVNKIIRSRDVIFDETRFFNPDDPNLRTLLRQEIEQIVELIETPEFTTIGDTLDTGDTLLDDETSSTFPPTESVQDSNQTSDKAPVQGTPPMLPSPPATEPPSPPEINLPNTSNSFPEVSSSAAPPPAPNPTIITEPDSIPTTPASASKPNTRPATRGTRGSRYPTISTRKPATRAHEISASLDEKNILDGRTRTRSSKNPDASLFTTLSTTLFQETIKEARLHVSNLPPEPRNWREMLRHPLKQLFLDGSALEMKNLQARGTFEEVDDNKVKQSDITPLPLMWVFKYKTDTNGYLVKAKSRLCVRGDLQHVEQDTYAATLAIETFRALVAIAAVFDLNIHQFDAINAFVNSTLDEVTYCYKPDGFQGSTGRYYLLRRALYGLKRSPLLWANELANGLIKLGLTPLPEFNCLYTNGTIILFYFVDDIAVLGFPSKSTEMASFEKDLCNMYEMRSLGDLQWFLGIRLIRDRDARKIWLCQDSYIKKICKRFGVSLEGKHHKVPLPTEKLEPNTLELDEERRTRYQEIVGSINYAAVITRLDVSKAVSDLARHLQNPSEDHLRYAHQTLSYLAGTPYLAIEYGGNLENPFSMSSDAAYADHGDRTSSQGFLMTMFGGAVAWKATKQSTVTTSSTEAELLGMSFAGKELIAWNRFFHQIQFDSQQPLVINGDNQQTIRILQAEAPKLTTKLRHVDVHQCWLREMVQKGIINIQWIPTEEMPADGLTKILTRQQHEKFLRLIRLADIRHFVEE